MQRKVSSCHTWHSGAKDVRSVRDEQLSGWFMSTEPGQFNPRPPSSYHSRQLEPAWARLTFLLGRSISVGRVWVSLRPPRYRNALATTPTVSVVPGPA